MYKYVEILNPAEYEAMRKDPYSKVMLAKKQIGSWFFLFYALISAGQ